MNELLDKSMLLVLCTSLFFVDRSYPFSVVPVIIIVIISALLSYFDNDRLRLAAFFGYILFCVSMPMFIVFLPVIFYDLLLVKERVAGVAAIWPFFMQINHSSGAFNVMTVMFTVISFLLNRRTTMLTKLNGEYTNLRDTTKEFSLKLEQKNKDLLEKQDYEIHLATLKERNRIARKIHDNVGHLLSSSLLQIGALLAINKDQAVQENLQSVKQTLSQAMDTIRSSVHDLHDDSFDLYTEIQSLIKNFTFCSVQLDYDLNSNPDRKLKYSFLSVIKEALSNIIKHSNATAVKITLREHPALFQLLIQDNGFVKNYDNTDAGKGIGLQNIADRVEALGGNVHISTEKGFGIFISVPKTKPEKEVDKT